MKTKTLDAVGSQNRKFEICGRSWFGFRRGKRIAHLSEMRIGQLYLMRSIRDGSVALNVIWLSGVSAIAPDTIKYFCWYELGAPFRLAGPDEGCTASIHGFELERRPRAHAASGIFNEAFFEVDPESLKCVTASGNAKREVVRVPELEILQLV